MYSWIWTRLPGPTPVRVVLAALLIVAVVLVLLFVVFPRVEVLLPFTDVGVDVANGLAY